MKFNSNGKLLITSEYLVMKGAMALAIPSKFDQELTNIGRNSDNLYLATIARFPIDRNFSKFNENSTLFKEIRQNFDRNCQPAAQMAEPLFLLTNAAI